jgi:signal transduction histidine kinase
MAGGLAMTVMMDITSRRTGKKLSPFVQRALFNMAANGLALAIGGGLYALLGGRVGNVALLSNVLPALLAAVCVEFVNAGAIVGVVSLQTRQPALHIWRQNVSWAIPMNIVSMTVGGGGLASGYHIAGHFGLVVFFLPLALTIYAFRLYVAHTKSQMASLEDIIAVRTHDLEKANQELKRLDATKTHFYSVINHEMRTPLTAVLGYTELLQIRDDVISPAERKRMMASVRGCSQRLLDLVNNMLDIARIEDGKLSIVQDIMEIVPVIDQALAIVQPMAKDKDVYVRVDVPPNTPYLWGDAKRVSQILINLLGNAVKYTPNTGRVTIAVRPSATPDLVEISVADTGIGIPADRLPFIFDRFSRIERAEIQHTVGTGLGLSIAQGLVKAHGGEIWVESEEGHGTCFSFTLPIAKPPTDELRLEEMPVRAETTVTAPDS